MSAAALVGRRVTVEVPATIANLGAGYDCLGLAVDLPLRVEVEARAPGQGVPEVEIDATGEGAEVMEASRHNRFVAALETGLDAVGIHDPAALAWRVRIHNDIPMERGLGSSAAAVIGGLVAAWVLAGRELDSATLLRAASAIEGHPDNVGPALLGGLVVSAADGDELETVRVEPPAGLRIVAWVPERRLLTADMRRVLPDAVPRADAVANLARVAIGVAGLAQGRTDVLRLLTQDRLHEHYRAAAYPELPALVAAAREAGAIGAFLAGSGSTVAAFVDAGSAAAAEAVAGGLAAAAAELGLPGRSIQLAPRSAGARVVAG